MKKFWVISLLILCMVIPSMVFAQGRNTTDRLVADTLICSGNCILYGILIETDGTNNATLIIYDNTSAAGKDVRKMIVKGANYYGGFELPAGLICGNGIYADVAGIGAAFWVTFGKY